MHALEQLLCDVVDNNRRGAFGVRVTFQRGKIGGIRKIAEDEA